ncbi:MAG: plasmid pRiA4b ORF-3 family protein [Bacteroidetes bacterium]|nr:plasmid pRiA4b ORF-3 family protein [Bacteroidota bacterium]
MIQLKITIDGITPPIWRSIQVPETYSLNKLHHIIQITFGWTNSHLYMFGEYENKIGDPILWEDSESPTLWDKKVKITDVLQNVGDELKYEYDMGDGWKHTVVLEKIEDGVLKGAKCLDGARNAPPEDCGGVHGYQELIHHRYHPEKDGYIELIEWLGEEYDPELFDLKVVNKELKGLVKYIREFDKENGL